MPTFGYRALTQSGEGVAGSISAASAAEVSHRVEYLGLVLIETGPAADASAKWSFSLSALSRPRPEDVTIFTRDLALLLKSGARLDDGLELLGNDMDVGRLRPAVLKIRAAVLAGE